MLEIRVVEGKLEGIKVSGTQRLNPGYVRSRLAIATGKPLNRDRLLRALQLLQLNPLIQNLSAELSAGSSPGVSWLEVRVREAKTFRPQIVLDNGRTPAVGSFRCQIQVSEANLLGWHSITFNLRGKKYMAGKRFILFHHRQSLLRRFGNWENPLFIPPRKFSDCKRYLCERIQHWGLSYDA